MVLCIEPWGSELPLQSGTYYLVVFEGPEGEWLAMESRTGRVTVYGWSGSVAWVLQNGRVVLSCETRVPEMPRRSEPRQ